MPVRALLLTLLCVALLAAGQMLFKIAATQWRIDGWTWATVRGFLSPSLLMALTLYAVATILWVFILRTVPLNLAFSVYALVFLLVPVSAHFILDESLTLKTLVGAAIIVLGVIVSVR